MENQMSSESTQTQCWQVASADVQTSMSEAAISQPKFFAKPETEEQVCQAVREAASNEWPLVIAGGATKQNRGTPLTNLPAVLSTQALTQVVAYEPEDLTITVKSGLPFETLTNILAEKNQWLPLDLPATPNATMGGITATDISGPKRLLYGSTRDLLIGARFVLSNGNVGKSGGRVVKNVTGYDLHKLMIGSYGTLGVLVELSFKVLPKPQASGWGVAVFKSAAPALQIARTIAASNLSPAALELLDANAQQRLKKNVAGSSAWLLCFAADGLGVAVKNQLAGMKALCEKAGAESVSLLDESESFALWNSLRSLTSPFNVQVRLATLPTSLPAALVAAENLFSKLGIRETALQVRAGTGLVYAAFTPNENQFAETARLLNEARTVLAPQGGSLVVESAPLTLRQHLDVWGNVGVALDPMKNLKNQLDPHGLFAKGRFVGGI
jgi:glycolate oxidase FAD binding subunit